ncbi:hypothetical protein I302_100377 [Kwoniella bestiolae CBS 10118]|uniref:tRNA-splicing endonuclease subunit Sen15 domain-containing protein n=1 Tax=Kwoniella bestiolae CBS 10118 TaxID=1296100 RepID=A0A1B9G4W2_9TREE|nr:hypothetical protein I302_03751 [Kwoniella bestiolae CBS 10118]OCF26074.1 hypothetical protein I302_03751 [Kwoniella bestiolae CBS 10118]
MTINPPSFLLPYLDSYPIQAGALLTTIYDLTLSVGWIDTRIIELGGWVALVGHKNKSDPLRAVIPLPIHSTSLKPSSLKSIFTSLSTLSIGDLPQPFEKMAPTMDDLRSTIEQHQQQQPVRGQEEEEGEEVILDKETIYTSIVTPDSTVVYYKISKGIKKPSDIPDE